MALPAYIAILGASMFAAGFVADSLSTKLLMTPEYVESNPVFAGLLKKHSFSTALGYEIVVNDLVKIMIVTVILMLGPLHALSAFIPALQPSFITALALGLAIAGSAHLDAAFKNVVGR